MKTKKSRFFSRVFILISFFFTLIIGSNIAANFAYAGTINTNGLIFNYDHSSFTSGSSTVTNLVSGKPNAVLRNNVSTDTPTMGGTSSRNYFTTTAGTSDSTFRYNNSFLYTETATSAASFGDSNNVSAFAWVYPTTLNHVVLEERGSNYDVQNWYDTQIEMVNGYYKFRIWNCASIGSSSTTTQNAWHYVGFTYNYSTNTLTAYIDGNEVAKSTACTRQSPFANSYSLWYGVGSNAGTDLDGNSNARSYGGFRFGALHIYNRAVSPSEISSNFSTKISQTITFSSLGTNSKTYPYSQVLSMVSSGTSGSGSTTYAISSGGTATGCSLSNASASATISATSDGTCLINATIAADTFYDTATSTSLTFTFSKASQTLTFATTSYSKSYLETQTVVASSLGTGAITYSAGSSTACSVSGSTVTITAGTGTCTISASRATDVNYLEAIANNSVNISVSKANQNALILNSTSGNYLTNLKLTTSGGSDTGTVSFSVSSSGTAGCSISNVDSLSATSAGTCQLVATKLGNENYLVASDTQTITFSKASLVLTMGIVGSATVKYGDTASTNYSTNRSLGTGNIASLNGNISYSTVGSTACSINSSSGLVSMTNSSGSCAVRVSLSGDSNYLDTNSATILFTPSKADTLTVTASSVTLTYTGVSQAVSYQYSISGLKYSDTLTAVSFVYAGSSNGGASLSGSSFVDEAGTYTITPSSAVILNSDSYTAISYLNGTLTVSRASRTINSSALSPQKYGDTFTVTSITSPSSNNDGSISYSASSSTACTVSSGTGIVTITSASGTCLITPSISEGNNYLSATGSAVSISPAKADTVTVTVPTPATLTYTGASVSISPSIVASGLVNGDSASGATFHYSRSSSCSTGGTCAVGDTGPAGGIVFYVSGTSIDGADGISLGGIYLEAAPASFSKTTYNWCEGITNPYTTSIGGTSSDLGSGAINTKIVSSRCSGGAVYEAANLSLGGFSDWFLPSKDEQTQMYNQRALIGFGSGAPAASYLFWGSTETANWHASSTVPWSGVGVQNKAQATPYWPIRAFSPTSTSYSSSTIPPINAGTYAITPSLLTLSNSRSTENYTAIIYETSTLTINKANQTIFSNYGALEGVVGSSFQIYPFGGSGDGAVILSVSNGTSNGCTASLSAVSTTAAGTCILTISKSANENYLQAQASFTITFLYFAPAPTPPVSTKPTEIAISSAVAWSINASAAPTITSISPTTGGTGTVVTITGTGLDGVTSVRIGRKAMTSVTGITSTSVTAVIPSGAISGPLVISNSIGSDFSSQTFTYIP